MASAENTAIKNILGKELLEIIADFTPQDRACVIGYYYLKKSVQTIADELGISRSNVKNSIDAMQEKIETRIREEMYL